MAKESKYVSYPFIFKSKGLSQRYATDRNPESTYQLMTGVLEREEESLSTRYGSIILNRDPNGTADGQNRPLPSAPVTLGRLLGLNGANWRYAGLANGTLYRIAGTTQGPYAEIASGLSGNPFTALVTTTQGSANPFLFIYDQAKLIKDSGTGSPTQNGIFPPSQPVIATQYAPEIQIISAFPSSTLSSYNPVNMIAGGPGSGAITSASWIAFTGSFTGYQVGDILTVVQGGASGGTLKITNIYNVLAAQIIVVTIDTPGIGYTTASNLSTTGGSGVGLQVNITASTGTGLNTIALVNGASGIPILSGDYWQYTDTTGSYTQVPDGMLGFIFGHGNYLKFNTFAVNNTYDMLSLFSSYSATETFDFTAAEFTIGASTVGYIGVNQPFDFTNYQDDDLIVLAVQCSDPENVQGIQIMFDVNGSGYTTSYYWKSIIPVSWQGSVSDPLTNDPATAMFDSVFDLAVGVTNPSQEVGQSVAQYPTVPSNLQGVQPSQLGSGQGSWSVIYIPKGQFQPAGNAGQSGADWSKITGWRIQITTNSNGGSSIGFNALYIQGSPTANGVGTNAGASSYGGVGYDFRFTYWDANTLTESNGCPSAYFSTTPTNPGAVSTLIPLRQAINLQLQYSPNPAVTHVRVYARGGVFGDNWYQADQVPNVTGTGIFNYDYILPDEVLEQGNILSLTNDVPVTSTLQNPIATTLSAALNPVPANTNTPTLLTITVAQAGAAFVPYQIVDIGGPQNLEQVYVVTGGTGTFTAYIQLPHAIGEQVNVYSIPGQPLFLAAAAYGQIYMAGDPNNPNALYYTPVGQPQYCPPQNYIPVGPLGPSDPITAVVNHRGTLFVRTNSTWCQIYPGNPPTWQSTGSKHGSPANFDWCLTESEILYQAWDGIRSFRGADASYMSLIIEWIYRDNPQALVPLVNLSELGSVISAFKNNTAIFSYVGQDGNRHRILWSHTYKRWRNDDVQVSAMLVEPDTNQLVYAIPYPGLAAGNYAIVYDSLTQDYDDGGWQGGALVESPIPMNLQLPYLDLGMMNNAKQWNCLTVDAAPNGQTINLQLQFDDNNGTVAPITLPPFTGTVRQKFQFIINAGLGQEAYKISPVFSADVTSAPILYQVAIEAAVLAAATSSYDSYQHKFGTDSSKLVKQVYVDYTTSDGNSILLQVFADGNPIPYYQTNLQSNTSRYEVPTRVRLPAIKLRLFRLVLTSVVADGSFQIWSPITVDWKQIIQGKGYAQTDLGSLTPD